MTWRRRLWLCLSAVLLVVLLGCATRNTIECPVVALLGDASRCGSPYECTFESGAGVHYVAQILGEDFVVIQDILAGVRPDVLAAINVSDRMLAEYRLSHSSRVGEYGYFWVPAYLATPEESDVEFYSFHYETVKDASPYFDHLFFYVFPPNDAACRLIENVDISMRPDVPLPDDTQQLLASIA